MGAEREQKLPPALPFSKSYFFIRAIKGTIFAFGRILLP